MTETDYPIVCAVIEDAEEILALQKQAFEKQALIYNCWTLPPLVETVEQWRGQFNDRLVLKALDKDRIIGSVCARQQQHQAKVGRLIVHPDYRCRGLGTRLMLEVESRLPEATRFELFTGHKSTDNISLYQRLGYAIYRSEDARDHIHLVFMEKFRQD